MTTRELLERLPAHVREKIEGYRHSYKNRVSARDEIRAAMSGYAMGLRDSGMLTELERRILFVYCTV